MLGTIAQNIDGFIATVSINTIGNLYHRSCRFIGLRLIDLMDFL
jgi:hypothetical protein